MQIEGLKLKDNGNGLTREPLPLHNNEYVTIDTLEKKTSLMNQSIIMSQNS